MSLARTSCIAALVAAFPIVAAGHPPSVEAVEARRDGSAWTIAVTLRHAETGWDDYADGWRVLASDGSVLGTRRLLHPHAGEQPFTRTLSAIRIPAEMADIGVEASTSAEGWSGEIVRFTLPAQ